MISKTISSVISIETQRSHIARISWRRTFSLRIFFCSLCLSSGATKCKGKWSRVNKIALFRWFNEIKRIRYRRERGSFNKCSNVHDFTIERIRIDMSLLLNDYPSAFITKHVSRFVDQYNAQSVLKQLNEQHYYKLHQKLFHQPTRREKQLQAIPTADVAQMPESLMRKKAWNPNILYAPYQFKSGPRTAFGPIFRTWWKEYLCRQGSKVAHVKVKFSAKSNRTREQCFVHNKPPKEMLKKMDNTLATTTRRWLWRKRN